AHAGKAQLLMRQGDVAGARAALAAAKCLASDVSEREASHIAFFDLVFAGQTDAAIAALYAHLAAWPRDALVVASAANPNGLIGGSGRIGQKHQIAALMDSLAPAYGDDFWFVSYHAMALSEDGQLGDARAKIERSVAVRTRGSAARRRGLARVAGLREQRAAAAGQWARRPACPPGAGRHARRGWARHAGSPDRGAGARRALPVGLLPSRPGARIRG